MVSSRLPLLTFALHEISAERLLRLILVVRPTSQPHGRHGGFTAASYGLNVVVFQEFA
jgi:hypothetical protein